MGLCLKAELRSGNVYSSRGAVDFVRPVLEYELALHSDWDLLLRDDSGFAVPELYDLCEQQAVFYVIRLKDNRRFFVSVCVLETCSLCRHKIGTS